MSITSEIQRINTNIANAYTELENKGATIPTDKNSNNLASTITTITGGGGGVDLDEYFKTTITKGTSSKTGVIDLIKNLPSALTISGTSAEYLFNNCTSLEKIVTIDFSNVTSMKYCFNQCSKLTKLPTINSGKVTTFEYAFSNCTILTNFPEIDTSAGKTFSYMFQRSGIVDLPLLDMSNANVLSNMLAYCSALVNVGGFKDLGKGFINPTTGLNIYTLNMASATNLTHDSIMNIINNLYDLNLTYDVANGGTLYTQKAVIGTSNVAKLTSDEILIATNKGWILS